LKEGKGKGAGNGLERGVRKGKGKVGREALPNHCLTLLVECQEGHLACKNLCHFFEKVSSTTNGERKPSRKVILSVLVRPGLTFHE